MECLEARDLPAPLAWFAAPGLAAARGGAVALAAQGSAFTVLGGGVRDVPYIIPADPAWQAISGSDVPFDDKTPVSPGAGIMPTGGILVFGGHQDGGAVATAMQYVPNASAQLLASMNTARESLGFATDGNGLNYAIGGLDDNGTPLGSMEYYTQSSNTWTYAAALPQTLYAESAAYDGNGHIFTFGGIGSDGTITSNVYEYTIASNTWTQVASMPSAVRDSAAVLGSNNLIYVLGGVTSSGTTAAVECYNPGTNTWNTETSLPAPLSDEAAVSDSLGRIEIVVGFDVNGNAVANVWASQELNLPDTAPTIYTTAPTTAWTGTPYTYQVFSTANPQATYSLAVAPSGMTIDSNTGLITWAPTQAEIGGLNTVSVQASNYAGQTTQTYNVTVRQSPPTVPSGITQSGATVDSVTLSWNPSTGPIGVDHYNVYHYYGTGHSGRGGGITYHYDLLGSTTTPTFTITGLTSGGTFSWYTITAVDPNGLSSGYSTLYTIHTLPDTVPPVLTLPSNQTVTATSPSGATDAGAFTATATDPGPGIDTITIVYVVGFSQIPTNYAFPIGTTSVTAIAEDLYGNYTSGNFTVTVVSSFPVLSLPANQIVEPTSSAGATDPGAFTATATDPQDSIASITYAVNGTQIDPTYVFAPGTTTVTVTATDTSGYSTTGTFTVLVEDIPPTLALSGLPTNNTVTEGTAIHLTASGTAGTSAENAYGLTFTWDVTKVHNGVTTANFASGSGSGSSTPITFTADDEGTYTLTVTDTDVNGTSTTVTQSITSTGVAPTTSLSGPGDCVVYQNRLFTFTASSPSPVDQASPFTFAINWGDGNSQNVTASSGVVLSHAYTATGSYSVSVTATDKDGFVATTATQTIVVATIENQNDPAGQGGGVGLAVGGTSGNDTIVVTTGATSGTVSVSLNGTNLGTFTPTGNTINVVGGGGTDTLTFKATSGAGAFSLNGSVLAYSNSGSGIPMFNLTLNTSPTIGGLVIQGGNTGSSYTVQNATIATNITAGSGNDTFTLADTGAATQAVTFNGGGGTNTLVGANQTNVWTINAANAGTLKAGGEPADSFSNIQNLTGGTGANSFVFANNTASISGSIDGKVGANTLDFSARTSAVTVTLLTTGLNKATAIGGTFSNIGSLVGSAATTDTLIGPKAATTWTISGSNSGSAGSIGFAGFENLTGGSATNTFAFTGTGNVTGNVTGGSSASVLDVSGYTSPATVKLQAKTATPIGGTWSNFGTFVGDNSTSTLVGPNTTNTWTINGTNKGTVGSSSFKGFANLTGGTGADAFKFSGSGNITGSLSGGGGTDTLNFSGNGGVAIAVNLQTGTASAIGGTFSGISALVGSAASTNTLTAANITNSWSITGANAGKVNSFTFSAIENLVGGSGVDVFTFNSAGKVASINGGGAPANQGDWLDYSSFNSAVTVNLATGVATNVNGSAAGSVSNIQNVHGGNGGNTLTGNAQGNILIGGSGANTIVGGSGRSFLIADKGASKITGGSGGSANGGDIQIAGYTSYDTMTAANEAALMSILAEWQSTDSYAARFTDINTGAGGGLNGSNQLNYGTTVFDNTKVNTLIAQVGTAALDWFFANTAPGHTTIHNLEAGEHVNNM